MTSPVQLKPNSLHIREGTGKTLENPPVSVCFVGQLEKLRPKAEPPQGLNVLPFKTVIIREQGIFHEAMIKKNVIKN